MLVLCVRYCHTATAVGLIYLLTWPLYSSSSSARYAAAAVVMLMTMRFILTGSNLMHDPQLVAGATVSQAVSWQADRLK